MATTVTFGGTPATDVVVSSATELTATAPAGAAAGAVDVVVATSTDETTVTGGYSYDEAPALPVLITADPDEIPTASGTDVTITGENLSDVGGSIDGRTYTLAYHDPNGTTFPQVLVTVVSDTEIVSQFPSVNLAGDYYWVVRDADSNEVSNQLPFTVVEPPPTGPVIESVTPNAVVGVTGVRDYVIAGTGLGEVEADGSPGATMALVWVNPDGTKVDAIADPITSVTDTEIQVTGLVNLSATAGTAYFVVVDAANHATELSNHGEVEVTA